MWRGLVPSPAKAESSEVHSESTSTVNDVISTVYAGTLDTAVAAVVERARSRLGGYVVLCNLHVLMSARRDERVLRALAGASYVMPDGAPVVRLRRRRGQPRSSASRGRISCWPLSTPAAPMLCAMCSSARRIPCSSRSHVDSQRAIRVYEVGLDAFLARRLRDHRNPMLDVPAQHHLRHRDAVPLGDLAQHRVAQVAALQRAVALEDDAALAVLRQPLRLVVDGLHGI